MYKWLSPLAVLAISGCGGGETIDPNDIISQTPAGTSIAATATKSFTQAGTGNFASGSAPTVSLKRLGAQPTHSSVYELTVNGTTYTLNPVSSNVNGGLNNEFNTTVGGQTISLFLTETSSAARIANAQIDNGTNKDNFFGIFGTLTAPANLPSGVVSFGGSNLSSGEVSVDNRAGGNDDATISNIALSINFGASSNNVSGSFDFADAGGDGRGSGIDIDTSGIGTQTISFNNGNLNGNTFTIGNVDLTPLENAISGSLPSASLNDATITGGIFGDAGDVAAGTSISLGQSTGGGNDLVVYTRIIAVK